MRRIEESGMRMALIAMALFFVALELGEIDKTLTRIAVSMEQGQ